MNKKIYYIVLLVIVNILICVGGAWALLIGMFCMSGGLFSEPTMEDYVIGILFYGGTYILSGVLNLIIYKIFKNKLYLDIKYFIIPTLLIFILGAILTLIILL